MKTFTLLDAIVVTFSLLILAGAITALVFLNIPQNNLPVLAGIIAGVLSLPTTYGAFRWGNSVGAKAAQDTVIAALTNTQKDAPQVITVEGVVSTEETKKEA